MSPTTRYKNKKKRLPHSQRMPQPDPDGAPQRMLQPDPDSCAWSDKEVEQLLVTILENGHTDFKNVLDKLPGRSQENYQSFLKTMQAVAKNKQQQVDEVTYNCNQWLQLCDDVKDPDGTNSPLEIALALKLLSLDGVVENHPPLDNAEGIDFGSCYRLLYQAVVGHPLQPINKASYDLVYKTLFELCDHRDTPENRPKGKHGDALKEVFAFIKTFNNGSEGKVPGCDDAAAAIPVGSDHNSKKAPKKEADSNSSEFKLPAPKPVLKCYTRKKPTVPALPVTVSSAAVPEIAISLSGDPKSETGQYCLKINDSETPLKMPQTMTAQPEEKTDSKTVTTLQMPVFNPLKVPVEWLTDSNLTEFDVEENSTTQLKYIPRRK